MRIRNLLSFLAFGIMIVFSVAYIGSFGIRLRPPDDRTNLSMTVADVNNLVVDSNVLLRGVQVGKVTNIATTVSEATIDFYVHNNYRIPAECDIRLENLSSLGESFIGLVPHREDGPFLRDGQHIAAEDVIQPASITELAVGVVRVLTEVDPDAVERIIGEADTALPDPKLVLPNLTRASTLLRNTTADMHGRGRTVLTNLQTLLQNAGWVGPAIADTTPGVRFLAKGVQQDVDGVGQEIYGGGYGPASLYRTDALMGRIQKLLDNNGGDLKVLGEALEPRLKAIAGALLNFDPSQILSNILEGVPEEGAITLHVTIPDN